MNCNAVLLFPLCFVLVSGVLYDIKVPNDDGSYTMTSVDVSADIVVGLVNFITETTVTYY